MEKCRLKINFKPSASKTTENPRRDSTTPLLQSAAFSETNSSSGEDFVPPTSGTMKRKRGQRAADKKGKHKEPVAISNDLVPNFVTLNTEDDSGLDDIDESETNSAMGIEGPSHEPDLPSKVSNVNGNGTVDRPVGRVKVKLRSSKTSDPHYTHSNTQTQSDTDKSNPQTVSEKREEVVEKMEDSANSQPEKQASVSGNFSRKAGSIKIKSSRGLGSSDAVSIDRHINQSGSPVTMSSERNHAHLDNEKTVASSMSNGLHSRELWFPDQDREYNQKELSAALAVIKKIMKMDSAQPFNAPVNPIALGIPDYFDVIETPMDFGTICNDLEHGCKYVNSEEVFRDVQFIWENCYRYNNKGDYIIDLMKRVKKNFMKYWMAAGLYYELPKRNGDASLDQDSDTLESFAEEDDHELNEDFEEPNGFGSTQSENVAPSSREKVYQEGNSTKHSRRRRHGIDLHKSDCLCAVCVVRRRKREREGNAKKVKKQSKKGGGNLTKVIKQEEKSPTDNLCSDDTSSNFDHSPEQNADIDMEDQGDQLKLENPEQEGIYPSEMQVTKENKVELQKGSKDEPYQKVLPDDAILENTNEPFQGQEVDPSGIVNLSDDQKDDLPIQQQDEVVAVHDSDLEQKPQVESSRKHLQNKRHNNLFCHENPLLLQICETLFSNDGRSVWSGPHSLVRRQASERSSIHAAVSMFMK